jgi:TRAP-type transport system periplasmic protein
MSRDRRNIMDRRHFLKVVGAAAGTVALGGLAAGCGGGAAAPTPAPAKPAPAQPTQAPAAAATKAKTARLAHVVAGGGALDRATIDFAKWIGEQTKGELTVQTFPGGQLGGERDMVESAQMGSIEIPVFGSYAFSNVTPEWGLVLDTPYVMRDQEHFRKVMDGPLVKPMFSAMLERKGIRHIGWANRGPRHLTSNKLVKEPADLKGVKIRVPEVETYMAAWRTLGATVTPMAFPEVFLALKQGTIDAQENPFELIFTSSFFEVQKYLALTGHIRSAYQITVSDRWFKTLSPELQKTVTEGLVEMGKIEDRYQAADEAELEKKLKEKGMTFNEVDRSKFQEALKELPKQFAAKWTPGFYEEVQAVR